MVEKSEAGERNGTNYELVHCVEFCSQLTRVLIQCNLMLFVCLENLSCQEFHFPLRCEVWRLGARLVVVVQACVPSLV